MSHRIINNVGYQKIYPMSLCEDDSFCHYCGRKPDILRALHWDHVPALNVRIPEGYDEIRKTLVRACSECNGLASDLPHLDYLERHFALKTLLIQRYHKLLLGITTSAEELGLALEAQFLRACVHNLTVLREQILAAIGFGIHDLQQIESPFLKRKNAEGKTLAALLLEYLTAAPTEPEPEEPHPSVESANSDPQSWLWSATELRHFIAIENEALAKAERIRCEQSYLDWLRNHPTRAKALELPEPPLAIPGFYWPTPTLGRAA